jgi:hypothetical protein
MRRRALRRRATLGVGTCIAVLAAAAPAHAVFPGTNGRIAYESPDDGMVRTMNSDGTGDVPVISGSEPAWSPDGINLAVARGGDIWVVRADGSHPRNLTNTDDHGESEPAWSPDGRQIAFEGRDNHLWAMSADGTGAHPVGVHASATFDDPAWSPDGSRIAFSSNAAAYDAPQDEQDDEVISIYTVPAAGGAMTRLTPQSAGAAFSADWNPDAQAVVFDGFFGIRRMASGGGLTPVLSPASSRMPAVSPDGLRIVYAQYSSTGGPPMLTVMDANGSNKLPLRPGTQPDWQSLLDTDGDALLDPWEQHGIDTNSDGTVDLDLPAMGADPRHKDIFVELDYMSPHQLDQGALDDVTDAFSNAPITNPDGATGITLHIDNGAASPMDAGAGTTWSTRSRQSSLTHDDVLGATGAKPDEYDFTEFDALKAANFPPERQLAFHYAISGHGMETAGNTDSGISRGIPAGDFLITLGSGCKQPGGPDCTLGPSHQAGTFMHELGHNLGLGHGGADSLNRKPSYLSVMNYTFQFPWLVKSDLSRVLDYSRFAISVDENALDEQLGFPSPMAARDFLTDGHCPDGKVVVWKLSGPLDFNCDKKLTVTGTVASSINGDATIGALPVAADWPRIVFNGGAVGASGAVTLPTVVEMAEPPASELLASEARLSTGVPEPVPGPETDPAGEDPGAGGSPPAEGTGSSGHEDPQAGGGTAVALPALSGLRLRPSGFRAARRGGSVGRRGGTLVQFSLTAPASVRGTVERLAPGRRRARSCVPPRRAPSGRRCNRMVRIGGAFVHAGRAGANRLRFTGRIGGRALAPGRYRLLLTPIAADGRAGAPRHVVFAIRR